MKKNIYFRFYREVEIEAVMAYLHVFIKAAITKQ